MHRIDIYTDGACPGNPGPGGFAALIYLDCQQAAIVSGGEPESTNNRMELDAVLHAITQVNAIADWDGIPITVHSDSKYVVDAFNQNWIDGWQRRNWRNANKKPVANPERWQELIRQVQGRDITWNWVPGHSGHPQNEECDQIAVLQASKAVAVGRPWKETNLFNTIPRTLHVQTDQDSLTDEPVRPEPARDHELIAAIHNALLEARDFQHFGDLLLEDLAKLR